MNDIELSLAAHLVSIKQASDYPPRRHRILVARTAVDMLVQALAGARRS